MVQLIKVINLTLCTAMNICLHILLMCYQVALAIIDPTGRHSLYHIMHAPPGVI